MDAGKKASASFIAQEGWIGEMRNIQRGPNISINPEVTSTISGNANSSANAARDASHATYVRSNLTRRVFGDVVQFDRIPRVKLEYELLSPLSVRLVALSDATLQSALRDSRAGEVWRKAATRACRSVGLG